jgi:hypothetical protein
MTTSTGSFPVMIIYGMAGLAAVAGIGFFFISSRSMKNTATTQQGIDPSNLVGYQTSASSGGYQTNRGEAQLKSDTDYNQTRSVYDESVEVTPQETTPQETTPQETTPQETIPEQTAPSTTEEAACGCAASAEIGTECDCEMHGSCLCDATCQCNADICKENVREMS